MELWGAEAGMELNKMEVISVSRYMRVKIFSSFPTSSSSSRTSSLELEAIAEMMASEEA